MSTYTVVPFDQQLVIAESAAKSGLFGMKTKEQALVLMAICESEGIHPARAIMMYHIVQGRPAMRADAMLARFQDAKGRVEWHDYSDTKVSGTFSHPQGGAVRIEWTIERARKIGLASKDNWKNYPAAMLRSRCVSEGVRTVYPGVVVGTYTEEETESFDKPKRKEKDMGPADVVKDDEQPAWDEPPAAYMKVDEAQVEAIHVALSQNEVKLDDFLRYFAKIVDLRDLQQDRAVRAIEWIREQKTKREGVAEAQKKPARAAA